MFLNDVLNTMELRLSFKFIGIWRRLVSERHIASIFSVGEYSLDGMYLFIELHGMTVRKPQSCDVLQDFDSVLIFAWMIIIFHLFLGLPLSVVLFIFQYQHNY
jgi:hypothetical protein